MTTEAKKPTINYLDHLPQGWFALDVLPTEEGKRCKKWAALVIDVDPDDLERCDVDFPALFYVDPDDYRPGFRKAHQGWFRIPGNHRTKEAAWDAIQEMMATRN